MKKLLTIILGVGIMVTVFAFSHIMSTKRENELPSIKAEVKKKQFAMYIKEGKDYIPYESDSNKIIPTGYIINEQLSYCEDMKGNKIEGLIKGNGTSITVTSNKTVYCTLYLDLAEIQGAFTFYIKDNIEDNYTKEKTNTGYLSWDPEDVASYCISESNDVNECDGKWEAVENANEISKDYTFTSDTNEEKTVYAYIKNNSGITKQANDTITLDTQAPVVNTFSIKSPNGHTRYTPSTSIKGDLTYNDNLSGVDEICIYNSNSSTSCSWKKVTSATSMNDVSGTLSSGSNKYMYAFAKDKAGNITTSGKQSSNSLSVESLFYAYLYLSSYTANSITVKTSASPSSGVASYKYTVSPSVSNSCTTDTCTITGLSAGTEYTITVTVTSNAGKTSDNSSPQSTLTIMPAKSYSTNLATICSGKTLNACMASEYSNLNTKISDIYLNQGGMARYQGIHGEVSNNYLCLGTSCSNEGDDMYRIIGITSDGQLKVIKQTQLSSTYKWHTSYSGDTQWPDSDLFHRLNDNGSGTYATSSFYYGLNSTLKSHIDDTYAWKYGTTTSSGSYNGSTIYTTENRFTTNKEAPIGLMYLHDYYLAYKGGNPARQENARNAWIFFRGNDSSPTFDSYEWTMVYGNFQSAWVVISSGLTSTFKLTNDYAIRPVFYLKSDIELTGDGTISTPYKIA